MSAAEQYVHDGITAVFTIMLIAVIMTYLLIPVGWTIDKVKEILSYRKVREQHRQNILRNRQRAIARMERELGMYLDIEEDK
jgi:hypothetical protein